MNKPTKITLESTNHYYLVLADQLHYGRKDIMDFSSYTIVRSSDNRAQGDIRIDWGRDLAPEQTSPASIGWFSTATRDIEYAQAVAEALTRAGERVKINPTGIKEGSRA